MFCNTFIGQKNVKLVNTEDTSVTQNLEWTDCIQSFLDSNAHASVEYNEISKECRKKRFGSYGSNLTAAEGTLYYTKIVNNGSQTWQHLAGKLIHNCLPCATLHNFDSTDIVTCKEECLKHKDCLSIKKTSSTSCAFFSLVAIPGGLLDYPGFSYYQKQNPLTLFNISTENICLESQTQFIKSIGDGIIECPLKTISIPANFQIKYTSDKMINGNIQISIYIMENDEDKCSNIIVLNDPNIQIQMCNMEMNEKNFCKFVCAGDDYNEIIIQSLSAKNIFCEIQILSEDRMINVCM
ncbi:DgyrCDS14797 [Dimorphilus gyrociliatus]|uniref:DgyrCDS14536 n=1 Tax=Dimorphilus gyrociliatus TaxID=2664684 RepID=A0A7I8WDZ1_9ANNE|nr:DgyrCDS14536 [Dimorphilus gyrociliatus]CAD5126741.1 DgyrCDS14797 [Dimorphilus gyrociliatus]